MVALGAGPEQIGAVLAVHGAAIVVALPFAGAAVDRFGRRGFLTGGALVMAAACFGFAAVESVGPLLYSLRVAQAFAFAMAFAAGGALAVDEAPPERVAQALGVFGLTFLSMNAVAPAVVEEVAGRAGWSAAFATSGVAALLCAALSRRLRVGRPELPVAGEAASLLAVALRPSALRPFAVIALVGVALCAAFAFHQPYALELGFERLRSFFVAYATCAVTVRVGFGHLMDRLGHRRAAIAALVLYVVMLLAAVDLRDVGLVPVGAGLGVAHGVFYPAWNAVAVAGARPDERGKLMSLFQTAFQVGFGVAALALGALAERRGYPAVFQAGALALGVALALLLASPEGRAQSQGGES